MQRKKTGAIRKTNNGKHSLASNLMQILGTKSQSKPKGRSFMIFPGKKRKPKPFSESRRVSDCKSSSWHTAQQSHFFTTVHCPILHIRIGSQQCHQMISKVAKVLDSFREIPMTMRVASLHWTGLVEAACSCSPR